MNDPDVDTDIHCSTCDAVCCRLIVLVAPEDDVPPHLTTRTGSGLLTMARDEDGWCVALDNAHLNCSIYATRPAICRRFAMGGPYCRAVRAQYAEAHARDIPLTLLH